MSQSILASSAAFPQLMQAAWQSLADALGAVVGVVVVQRRGHDEPFQALVGQGYSAASGWCERQDDLED
jgi:hypothetical protein